MTSLWSTVAGGARAALLGTSSTGRTLLGADAALRSPVGTSRRITVLSPDGGTGATTLTAVVAGLLAARRTGPVLAVDLARGPASLAGRCGTDHVLGLDALRTRPVARTLAQAQDGLPTTPSGLRVIGSGLATVADWDGALSAVGRFFEVVVTDAGLRDADSAAQLAASSHVTAVVVRADVASTQAGLALVATIAGHHRAARTLLVTVSTAGLTAAVPAALPPGAQRAQVPYDRALARSLDGRVPALGLATTLALSDVAGHLVDQARGLDARAGAAS